MKSLKVFAYKRVANTSTLNDSENRPGLKKCCLSTELTESEVTITGQALSL